MKKARSPRGSHRPEATISADANSVAQGIGAALPALLQPFLDQTVIRSIAIVGRSPEESGGRAALLFTIGADRKLSPLEGPPEAWDGETALHQLSVLRRHIEKVVGSGSGEDLLVLPAGILIDMVGEAGVPGEFRAVAVLTRRLSQQFQRQMFDRGLVSVGLVSVGRLRAQCFLASDAVRTPNILASGSRGSVQMSRLGLEGEFADQLFQYAFIKLYALRHGLTARLPVWQGKHLYALADLPAEKGAMQKLNFRSHGDAHLRLFESRNPPANVDFMGDFQEIPECWRPHRPLLRTMFRLPPRRQAAVDAWIGELTGGGKRTLVAVHVRCGDDGGAVPEAWYLDWLREIWPTLTHPVLYVATDDPEAVLPRFKEFAPVSSAGSTVAKLPAFVCDFEALRRADVLAISDSSFSRMASILAPDSQRCFLPSFEQQTFVPYEPWIDPGFRQRFKEKSLASVVPAPVELGERENGEPGVRQAIHFDVTDLLLYLLDHTTLSGIQRVQCEIILNQREVRQREPVRFVIQSGDGLSSIDSAILFDIAERLRSFGAVSPEYRAWIRALFWSAPPCSVRPGDLFLTTGAFWAPAGMARSVQHLKNAGVRVGMFVHDIIPMVHPEYCHGPTARAFGKAVYEMMSFADFVLTSSDYNREAIDTYRRGRGLAQIPIDVLPLAHELGGIAAPGAELGPDVTAIVETEYVLCVGTIEVRKNPAYLFQMWKLMTQSERQNIPTLILAGRRGWLLEDFFEQLEACNYLGGKIALLHDLTDAEIDALYRNCLLTMFPSFVEGWGLPVGESLAKGKICLASPMGGIPEVGGPLADYIDPYNVRDGLAQLTGYLDDPEHRRRREREIASGFRLRTWRDFTFDLFSAVSHRLEAKPPEGIAAVTLVSNLYLPVSSDANAIEGDAEGSLSAELACISGWHRPGRDGAWSDGTESVVRFRAAGEIGARIYLTLRLVASDSAFGLQLASASGTVVRTTIEAEGTKMVVLPCAIEPDNLITVTISLDAGSADAFGKPPRLKLEGLLYIQPAVAADEAAGRRTASTVTPKSSTRIESAAIALHRVAPAERRRAASLADFISTRDSYLHVAASASRYRGTPIFADRADRALFHEKYSSDRPPRLGDVSESVRIRRRADQFVSMSRFTEGVLFDASGVSRQIGYLNSPAEDPPWLTRQGDGSARVEKSWTASAPFHEGSYLIFYNGNLHNYYHWLVEGIVPLHIMREALGALRRPLIALPRSVDVHAVLDHRRSIEALGFGDLPLIEMAPGLIRVEEAIWVDPVDLIDDVPASSLQSFRQSIAARYAKLRGPRRRRIFVERKGPTRMIDNQGALEALLAKRGFETVSLEGKSVAEQIVLFQEAEFIVGTHGAGLSNLLFCEAGTKVIEFMPTAEMRPFFWLISDKVDLIHAMQFCGTAKGTGFQGSIHVDLERFDALYRMVEAHR